MRCTAGSGPFAYPVLVYEAPPRSRLRRFAAPGGGAMRTLGRPGGAHGGPPRSRLRRFTTGPSARGRAPDARRNARARDRRAGMAPRKVARCRTAAGVFVGLRNRAGAIAARGRGDLHDDLEVDAVARARV